MANEIPDHGEDSERFQKAMREIDEEAMVLLRAHLLIEKSLNGIIYAAVHHPRLLEDERFNFPQRLAIARSLCEHTARSRIWSLIVAFNSLRNSIAHSLCEEVQRVVDLSRINVDEAERLSGARN